MNWHGEAWVKVIGMASWSIPATQVTRIEKALDSAGFADLTEWESDSFVTDEATCNVTVEYADGSSKTIEDYLGERAPRQLRLLEARLDALLRTAPYVGHPSERTIRGPRD